MVLERDHLNTPRIPYNPMNARIALLTALLAILLCTSSVAAAETVTIRVDNGRTYFNPRTPVPYERYVAFWYLYGDQISWWQGGIKFVYLPGSPEYEVAEQFFLMLPEKLGIKVVEGEITLHVATFNAEYLFSGVVEYRGYMFIDDDGKITVEFEYGKSLNVTVYSKVTVNKTASRIQGYGFADWKRVKIAENTWQTYSPEAEIPANSYVLVIPTEGIVDVKYSARGYYKYLGAGPALAYVGTHDTIVKAGQTYWDRQPDWMLVYEGETLSQLWLIKPDLGYEAWYGLRRWRRADMNTLQLFLGFIAGLIANAIWYYYWAYLGARKGKPLGKYRWKPLSLMEHYHWASILSILGFRLKIPLLIGVSAAWFLDEGLAQQHKFAIRSGHCLESALIELLIIAAWILAELIAAAL